MDPELGHPKPKFAVPLPNRYLTRRVVTQPPVNTCHTTTPTSGRNIQEGMYRFVRAWIQQPRVSDSCVQQPSTVMVGTCNVLTRADAGSEWNPRPGHPLTSDGCMVQPTLLGHDGCAWQLLPGGCTQPLGWTWLDGRRSGASYPARYARVIPSWRGRHRGLCNGLVTGLDGCFGWV